jgi:hypothetical protein
MRPHPDSFAWQFLGQRCIAMVSALRHLLSLASGLSLAVWFLLGFCGSGMAQQPEPPTSILSLVNSGTIDLHSPLRWHGTLRDEPAILPGGISYHLALSSVDYQEHSVPLNGGLRNSPKPPAPDNQQAGQ